MIILEIKENHSEDLLKIYAEERKLIPPLKFAIVFGSFLIFQLLKFMQGSKSLSSILGFMVCSTGYWIVAIITPIFAFVVSVFIYIYIKREEKIKLD